MNTEEKILIDEDLLAGGDEGEDLAKSKSSSQERRFDEIIGHIEDICVDEVFQNMQTEFLNLHYKEFDDSEENKLCYTPIFNEYVGMLEKYIEKELHARVENFDMRAFMTSLHKRRDEVSEELFEMLSSFTDFLTFKELVLDHKAYREGNVVDLSFGITVTSLGNNPPN